MTTWEQVRDAEDKAQQMATQTNLMGFETVMQFARVGQMLIEMKETCKHGEFLSNARSTAHLEPRRIQERMTLARYVPLLEQHKPKDHQSALLLIKAQQPPKPKAMPAPKTEPEQPEGEDMKTGGYIKIAERLGLISASTGPKARHKVRDRIEELEPGAIESKDAVRIEGACRIILVERNPTKAAQEAQSAKEELPASWQKKFDAALKARIEIEIADMTKQFEEQLREAKEQLSIKLQEAEAEREAAFQYRLGIDSHMTMDEFKLVRSCLHPDKAPPEWKDRYDKAFTIFNRLEKTVNTKTPISILRRHGWEKASPFYKAA